MNCVQLITLISIFLIGLSTALVVDKDSLISCYQCVRNNTGACPEESLSPCPRIAKSCIKEVSRDDVRGLMVKRECAVGPCSAIHEISSISDECDPKKNKFYCISCCTGNACNHSSTINPTILVHFVTGIVAILLGCYKET